MLCEMKEYQLQCNNCGLVVWFKRIINSDQLPSNWTVKREYTMYRGYHYEQEQKRKHYCPACSKMIEK